MSNAALQRLEDRMARLEVELSEIKVLLSKEKECQPSWLDQMAGSMKDSLFFPEVVKEIQKNRRAEYREANRAADAAKAKAAVHRKKREAKTRG